MFFKLKFGCLLGCLVGFCSFFLLLFALGFGVYCYFVPETWDRTVARIERIWGSAKDKGDQGWGKVKESGDHLVDSVPRNEPKTINEPETANGVPEPEVKR